MQQRRKNREECEAAQKKREKENAVMEKSAEEHVPLEKFQALEVEYKAKISELAKLKEQCLMGRVFPSESLLKEDDNLTSFYTGLPSHSVLVAVFTLVEKCVTEASLKLTNFQCFLLTLMKLRLNLANYDLGFRFSIHESTVSRNLINWLQIMDVHLAPLIHWPENVAVKRTICHGALDQTMVYR